MPIVPTSLVELPIENGNERATGWSRRGAVLGALFVRVPQADEARRADRGGRGGHRRAAASTAKITDVVQLIATIAEQANPLALNATIETARARPAGASRWSPVRSGSWPRRGPRAAEDVTGRVAAIEADTARAVTAIDAISSRIAQVNVYPTAIAAAVEEQAATTSEMARNIAGVAGTSPTASVR